MLSPDCEHIAFFHDSGALDIYSTSNLDSCILHQCFDDTFVENACWNGNDQFLFSTKDTLFRIRLTECDKKPQCNAVVKINQYAVANDRAYIRSIDAFDDHILLYCNSTKNSDNDFLLFFEGESMDIFKRIPLKKGFGRYCQACFDKKESLVFFSYMKDMIRVKELDLSNESFIEQRFEAHVINPSISSCGNYIAFGIWTSEGGSGILARMQDMKVLRRFELNPMMGEKIKFSSNDRFLLLSGATPRIIDVSDID